MNASRESMLDSLPTLARLVARKSETHDHISVMDWKFFSFMIIVVVLEEVEAEGWILSPLLRPFLVTLRKLFQKNLRGIHSTEYAHRL